MNIDGSRRRQRILTAVGAFALGQILLASTANAQEPPPPQMCGDGTTFTVNLPGHHVLPGGVRAPDDSITLPNGCRIYALLVSGYERNPQLDELTFYKLAKFVSENNGYVHWAWWNNLLKEYMARPLHDVQVTVPVLGTIGSNPGGLAGVHSLGFVPKNFGDVTTFMPKAVPEEDFQFQADAELFLKAVRANNPNAVIVVAGHSMGGDAVARLGQNPNVPIDLLAPIDPVGNRSRPVGQLLRNTFNWNRWRVANTLLGYRQRNCVRNSLGLCQDFDPRPFRVSFQCTVGPILSDPPLIGSLAPLICPQLLPIVVTGPRPTIGANVRFLYHRWQHEFVFPFDFGADEPLSRGPLTEILGGNYQRPVFKNALNEGNRDKTCGVAGNLNVGLLAIQTLGPTFTFPALDVQPGDPRDPNIFCVPLDGHGEIVGFRRLGIEPLALQAQGNWPVFDRTQGINDAPARRQKLVDMATAPSPNPNKTIVGPHNWVHEPLNPNLDLVADDLVYLAQHVLDQIPPTADITPPTSSAVLTPASNDNGWNNADAVVTLTATDNPGGSGVKEIEFSLSGAQSDTGTQDGDTADINILNEGMTMVTFFARDVAGNPETPANTLDINLDKTPPSIEAVATPPPNASGWNNSDVTVTFSASDTLSGVAELSPMVPVLVTDEGGDQEIIGAASDRADNHSAAAALVSLDKTAPELTGAPDRAPDSNGWYNQPLTVTWSCTDALSGVQSFITLSNYSGPDSAGASVSGDCFDLALNNTIAAMGFQFDATSPEIDVTTPPAGASYLLNAAVTSAYACTDNLSGVASCIGPVASGNAVDTATVNAKQFTVDAADVAGNHAGATHVYSVHYEFSGFRSPVGGTPAVNVAKAGRTIPIKYQLRDANGVSISDLGSFVSLQSAPIACGAGAPSGIVGENATASGGTVLRYDGTAGQFVYNWDTSRSWTGCRALQLTLNDGTKHLAVFQFK